jgi:tRNA pseudouridine38-40 synthase
MRTIHATHLTRQGDELVFTIHGNAFLYNMVRIIAGTLMYVGLHKLPEDAFTQAIETGDRLLLGPTAPPQGLCLNRVFYEAACM